MWPFISLNSTSFIARVLRRTSRARREGHNEQSQEEDIGNPSVRGSLRSPKIRDGCVNHAAQVTKKE